MSPPNTGPSAMLRNIRQASKEDNRNKTTRAPATQGWAPSTNSTPGNIPKGSIQGPGVYKQGECTTTANPKKKLPDPKRTRKRANQRAGYENTGEERFNVRGLHKSAPSPAIHVQRGGPLKGFIYPRPKRWPIKGIYHMQQNCRERRKTLTHPRLEAKRRTLHVP